MKIEFLKRSLMILTLTFNSSLFAQWPHNDLIPPELAQANEHFLAARYQDAARDLVELLKTVQRTEVTESALVLFDAVLKSNNCDTSFVDWTLPDGVNGLRVSQMRREQAGKLSFRFDISGNTKSRDTISQLKVRHADGRVILDKNAALGEWGIKREDDGFKFVLEQERQLRPIDSGLYFIDIVTSSNQKVEGYVIVSNHVSSETPVVLRPRVHESLTNRLGVFSWEDFKSPEMTACEWRYQYGSIREINTDPEVWDFDRHDADLITKADLSDLTIKNGKYVFSIRYGESRKFGPVKIRRLSHKVVPFSVVSESRDTTRGK
ncbi:MAG: DUF2861 family protein [Proteobacteria bacterium]|nr:DUF2861 family protein [Pseudomonadota bacterium]